MTRVSMSDIPDSITFGRLSDAAVIQKRIKLPSAFMPFAEWALFPSATKENWPGNWQAHLSCGRGGRRLGGPLAKSPVVTAYPPIVRRFGTQATVIPPTGVLCDRLNLIEGQNRFLTTMISVLYCGDSESSSGYLRRALKKHCEVQYLDPGVRRFSADGLVPDRFDSLILSDIGRRQLGEDGPRRIKEYVQGGGGFLMIGGFSSFSGHQMKGNYHNSDVEAVLPVECSSEPDDIAVYRGFHPTPTAMHHPIMSGSISWNDFPVLVGYNRVKPKEKSSVLLRYNDDPILAVQEFGRGRAAAFTSDCAPHWCGGLVDWPHYDDFWFAIVRWLAEG